MRKIFVWVGSAIIAGGIGYMTIPEALPEQGSGYYFVVFDSTLQPEIDALGILSDGYRTHPTGSLRLSNKDGNISLDSLEIEALSALDVLFVPSGKIDEYLAENGWHVGGGE
mgnify:CR=1 FL=1